MSDANAERGGILLRKLRRQAPPAGFDSGLIVPFVHRIDDGRSHVSRAEGPQRVAKRG